MDERQTEEGGATEYLVRYVGFGEADDLWQSAENLHQTATKILA
eukprot:COSAG02_NODE_67145_length_253_cov_1.344156_1_plen_44_part_00